MTKQDGNSNDKLSQSLEYQLDQIIENLPEDAITFDHILSALGIRSFTFGILIFALPMILPMPPGIPMASGVIISIFAAQVLMSKNSLWIPSWIKQKSINKNTLISAHHWFKKYLGWVFSLAKPRLEEFTGPTGTFIAALFFLILGVLMILPIPVIGNILPAFACTVLAIGLINNDGVIFFIGFIVSIVAIISSVLMALGVFSVLVYVF